MCSSDRSRTACLAVIFLFASLTSGQAQTSGGPTDSASQGGGGPQADQPAPALIDEIQTRHDLEVNGKTYTYTATVGSIGVPEEAADPKALVYFTSYRLDGVDVNERPLSFVVNGGPGAASAFLQLGALGPKELVFGPEGGIPAPPARTVANPASWLPFTDLVFIDPVGTGFSRPEADESGSSNEQTYWSIDSDLQTLGMFIRQYLTRNQRWQSPKVLVGESYGGFRMASLAAKLPEDFGISANGVVLISPALEFGIQRGASWDALPWLLRVPSMAAIARVEGKAAGTIGARPRTDLADVENFALGPLLSTMAAGGRNRPGDEATYQRLATEIGLPASLVRRERGRITIGRFADRLLEDEDRALSVYDGSLTMPRSQGGRGSEDYLTLMSAAFATAYAQYVREELGVATKVPYLMLNQDVFRRWRWSDNNARRPSEPGAADDLASAMLSQPQLRLLIAHGAFDLVTPYFASVYLMDQLFLAPSVHDRAEIAVYPGGHMFYGREESRRALHDDAERFYARITPHQQMPRPATPQ